MKQTIINPYIEILSRDLFNAKLNDNFILYYQPINEPIDRKLMQAAIDNINARTFDYKFTLLESSIKLQKLKGE